MKLDFRTKCLAVAGGADDLVGDEDARRAVSDWYQVRLAFASSVSLYSLYPSL